MNKTDTGPSFHVFYGLMKVRTEGLIHVQVSTWWRRKSPRAFHSPHSYPLQHTTTLLCVVSLSFGIVMVSVCRCLGAKKVFQYMLGLRTFDSEKWKDKECVLCLIPPACGPKFPPIQGAPPRSASSCSLHCSSCSVLSEPHRAHSLSSTAL